MSGETTHFKSKDFALRAQKKILSQFSSRKTAKMLINENLSSLLDLTYQLIKTHTNDKKVAEKFVKNLIKLSIKIGILSQNEQFSTEEAQTGKTFADKFRNVAMTVASFTEVDFSYDQKFLLNSVDQCEELMSKLVQKHLTDKSLGRINFIGNQLRDTALLDKSFTKGTPENDIMIKIVEAINKAIENGDL